MTVEGRAGGCEARRVPELPDITIYVEALERRIVGRPLEEVRIESPSLLRSVEPSVAEFAGKEVQGVWRLGKRVVLALEEDLFAVIHLMVAGRFRWKEGRPGKGSRRVHAHFLFPNGVLTLTEAGTKKRSTLHLLRGEDELALHDPGGVELFAVECAEFREVLSRTNHTLKRALTDPHLLSGVGNAYSDEILHAARLSPVKLTDKLSDEEWERLYRASRSTLETWTQRLRDETGEGFPEKVTAFRPGMAVHGRYREPCPVCESPIQRIVRAENEINYCALCQTGGKVLADRALSRLLKKDWPRTLEELEQRRPRGGRSAS